MKQRTRVIVVAAGVVSVAAAATLVPILHPWSARSTGVTRPGPESTTGARSTPAAASSAEATPAAALHPGLNVAGNELVDGNGRQVILHGADISGTESTCAQNWTTDPFGGQPEDDPRTVAAMHAWHLNAIRIPLNEDCWLGINGVEVGGPAYRSSIASMVRDYAAGGFYVIVDLHWSAPGNHRALAQNPAPDEEHSPAFWKSVAETFRGDDRVVFDLFNEPYFYWVADGSNEWRCLWDGCEMTQLVTGGSPYTLSEKWSTAGFTQLISVIRGTGASNLVLAAGANWARDLSGWLEYRPHDSNLAASWHAYTSANPSSLSECAQPSCWNGVVAHLAGTVPVVVGETGDSTTGQLTFLPTFIPWADSHHVGYLVWTWNAWKDPNNVLVTDMLTGAPSSGEGAFIRSHLAGAAAPG